MKPYPASSQRIVNYHASVVTRDVANAVVLFFPDRAFYNASDWTSKLNRNRCFAATHAKIPPRHKSSMFKKILIANRGEIAVRILRACRELGVQSVSVFSKADRKSLHVRLADEAYAIGPAPARESYLRIDKLIDVARRAGCDALHPGYGFLAENAALPRACSEAGITFIGPPAEAMESLGSKTAARQLARRVEVPTVPGTNDPTEKSEARALAQSMGYPVLLKGEAGARGRLRQRRHDGISGGPEPEFLFSRSEHAVAGRASCHGTSHRPRSCQTANRHRRRASFAVYVGSHHAARARDGGPSLRRRPRKQLLSFTGKNSFAPHARRSGNPHRRGRIRRVDGAQRLRPVAEQTE